MKLIEVYEFLKTRCPNHKVSHGFDWDYTLAKPWGVIEFKMVPQITVSTMIGNLSHAITAGYSEFDMYWPDGITVTGVEPVTEDTLEEMGMKPNT